jgi:hypothetical protein
MPPRTRSPRTHHERWPQKARRLAVTLAPVLLASAVVAASLGIRVTTPVALEFTARSVTFSVAHPSDPERRFPLLNNATVFSALALEDCGSVVLPAMHIALDGQTPAATAGAVTFRCDATVPGSKVVIRANQDAALGIVDRVTVRHQDTVRLELASADPPAVRLQMGGDATLEFSLRREVPFGIATEFADADGLDVPPQATQLVSYDAYLPEAAASRQATLTSLNLLSVVVELADDENVATLFRKDVDIPLGSISLFRRDEIDQAFVSTVIKGQLTYPEVGTASVPFGEGDPVRFTSTSGVRLTNLGVDVNGGGLVMTVEGDADELSTNGTDRRVRLFDRLVSDRNRSLLAIVAVLASQFVWLRQQWGQGKA